MKQVKLKSSGYRVSVRDPIKYLYQSLSRLALFAGVKRIQSPEQCKAALDKVPPELFFAEQYEVLRRYANNERQRID